MNNVVYCDRCDAPCRVAPSRNPDAKLLRASTEPRGLCASCAATQFLQNSPMARLITNPEMLLNPTLREQFAKIMKAGKADADPREIDWQHVVEHWALPFKKSAKRQRSKKSRESEAKS